MRPRITSVGLIMPPQPSGSFAYPAHIEPASIDALPAAPGVYLFLDRRGAPLYIGKSVNIRTRVLSHLRTPEEEAMLNESHRVDFLRTGGEIGALLLESKLIKEMQPPYNVLLRYADEAFALQLGEGQSRPRVVGSDEFDFKADDVYGFFASRNKAEEGMRALARKHGLCPALLGIEAMVSARGCFARQLGRCRGACIGKESMQKHATRLRHALEELRSSVWPFAGRIGIVEEHDGVRHTHVIDRWCYLGSLQGRRKRLARAAKHVIDVDTYRILSKPMLLGELRVVEM
jgi:excinuclease Cho